MGDMMKVAQKDFRLFRKYFMEYRKLFGLTGYRIYFRFEPLGDGTTANITVEYERSIATVRLGSSPYNEDDFDIKSFARHEALHLLLGRFNHKAYARFVSEDEIREANEEVVMKLEQLVK